VNCEVEKYGPKNIGKSKKEEGVRDSREKRGIRDAPRNGSGKEE